MCFDIRYLLEILAARADTKNVRACMKLKQILALSSSSPSLATGSLPPSPSDISEEEAMRDVMSWRTRTQQLLKLAEKEV